MRLYSLKFGIALFLTTVFLFICPFFSIAADKPLFEGHLSLLQAVRYTIGHETNIKMEKSQVTISLGTLQIATGQFDTTFVTELKSEEDDTPFSELDAIEVGQAHQLTQTYSLKQSVTKNFRYGTTIGSHIGVERNDNKYPEGTENTDNGVISFSLTQPLLRGRGFDVTGATEASKQQLYQAELHTLRHIVAQKVYETVVAYRNFQGAQEKVHLYETAIERIKKSIDQLQELIDGEEKPASDLNHYLANLATRKIDLLSANQELLFTAQTLAVAMGIPYTQEVFISSASKQYPDPEINTLRSTSDRLTEIAFVNRGDLLAQEKKLIAAKHMLNASQNGMLSQLDLSLNVKYSDVLKGEYKNDTTSVSASLSYEIPVGNNVATGQMLSARASYRQVQYQIEGLKRNIRSQISTSVDALKTYSHIKKQYESVLALDEQRVKDEKIQYSLGTSNLLLVIAVEDSLTTTRINLANSKVQMANALIRLRYATGTILASDQKTFHIREDSLSTVPENIAVSFK